MDPRIEKLSHGLVNYSCKVQPGEKVLIEYEGNACKDLVKQLIRDVYKCGGFPFVNINDSAIKREIMLGCHKEQLDFMHDVQLAQMQGMQCYIAIRGTNNISELADVPAAQQQLYNRTLRPVTDYRIDKTKWVVLRYPNESMAQLSNTSLDAFTDFYFNVCNLDYSKMATAMEPLVSLMEKTDKVRLTGPGTDLTFSIKDIAVIPCAGEMNIPDGEVFTAPVKDSINGRISYNTQSSYQGYTFENISFEFKDGKIIKATANDTERINHVLDTDEGARYVGEFAIGVNPYVLHPMKDTLFDEKICGSFHFTPGCCYEEAPNGNKSAIHWDLVNIQRADYGGGEIWFDDVLIRKDGIFVLPELECLNPENLK